jgi:hypothetical protein
MFYINIYGWLSLLKLPLHTNHLSTHLRDQGQAGRQAGTLTHTDVRLQCIHAHHMTGTLDVRCLCAPHLVLRAAPA